VTPPLNASVPLKETESGWLYQPLLSAGRPAAAVTNGAVLSYFNANESLPLLPAASVHAPDTCAVAASVE
jgi:hypothetical protein